MKARELVRELMTAQEVSNAALARRLNMTIAACWDLTGNPERSLEMNTKKLVEVLKALDYKVIAVPRDEKVPKGGYVID